MFRLLAFLMLCLPFVAAAQTYPERPVRLLVGFPPGTGPDIVARTVGERLSALWKQSVVIDNRAGAGGQIAAQVAAKSPADGYTLLLGDVGPISIAPAAFSRLPYDPAKELAPIAEVVRLNFVLVVPASSPARDLSSFVAAARTSSDRINFASFGPGSPSHFAADMFAGMAGFKVEPVHYRATGDAVTALISGSVQAAFLSPSMAVPLARSGKMRMLAATTPERSPLLPEVQTFAEAGWPKMDLAAWFAIFAPAGTPTHLLDAVNRHVVAAVQDPEVRRKLQEAGFAVTGTSRASVERMVASEAARWTEIVKASGFKGD